MFELTQQASQAASNQTIQAKLSNRGSSTWVKPHTTYAALASTKKMKWKDQEIGDLAKLAESNEH
jgi:hypothetical protein